MRSEVLSSTVDEAVCKYIVALVNETRHNPMISLGASPRASLALMRISQAWAYMHGRNYVTPEDVKAVFRPVISHRLLLTQEARIAQKTPEALLSEILLRTPVPFKGSRKAQPEETETEK